MTPAELTQRSEFRVSELDERESFWILLRFGRRKGEEAEVDSEAF